MLKLENVSKFYRIAGGKKYILNGIDFEIKKGEMVSITGKSGSGKSTLLNVVSGITKPSGGKIFFLGKRIFYFLDIQPAGLRNRKIGFIFQTFRLLPGETVMSNILIPARIKGWIGRETRDYITETMKNLEIYEYRNTRVSLLSGGQKQRVAVARALINKPELILADEPTANLDKETSTEICRILVNLAKAGFAVITVTHQEDLFANSDRVFRLADGSLKEMN